MNSYKGFEYPTMRDFFADEEKYTNPDNPDEWKYNLGGFNIIFEKDMGAKEIDEKFKYFIDVVYEDAKKVIKATGQLSEDVSRKNKAILDAFVKDEMKSKAEALDIDLETLNKATEDPNVLTEEQVDQINKAFDKLTEESEELKTIAELPSNNGVLERDPSEITEVGEMKVADATSNPTTGLVTPISSGNKEDELDNETFDEFLERVNEKINNQESTKITHITEEELVKYLASDESEDTLNSIVPKDYPLQKDSIHVLMDIVDRKLAKEDFHAYKYFTPELKELVDNFVKNELGVVVPLNDVKVKTLRNQIADDLVQDMIMNLGRDRMQGDLNKEIQKVFEKGGTDIADKSIGYSQTKLESYRKSVDNMEDEAKKQRLNNILDRIQDGYTLDSLKEYSKRCKIKKFSIEKPEKIIKRVMNKYKDSTYDIYSINNCAMVLKRNLSKDNYRDDQIIAFLLAFCMQCMNYDITNILDHSYMFYFTYNISLLDLNNAQGNTDTSEVFLNNVKEVIANLIKANPYLA